MTNNSKKIYRSLNNRWIAGVCAGFAEYLNIDPLIVRLLFILMLLIGGSGFLFYIIAWIIIPVNPLQTSSEKRYDTSSIIGFLLVLLGIFFLLENLDIIRISELFEWWNFFSWGIVGSLLLIVIGLFLIFRQNKKAETETILKESESETISEEPITKKFLHRSLNNKKISGVCGGLAEYLDIDATIIRLLFILITLSSFGLGLFLYVILAIVMPGEKKNNKDIHNGTT